MSEPYGFVEDEMNKIMFWLVFIKPVRKTLWEYLFLFKGCRQFIGFCASLSLDDVMRRKCSLRTYYWPQGAAGAAHVATCNPCMNKCLMARTVYRFVLF